MAYALSQWERQILEELRQQRRGKQVILPDDFLRLPDLPQLLKDSRQKSPGTSYDSPTQFSPKTGSPAVNKDKKDSEQGVSGPISQKDPLEKEKDVDGKPDDSESEDPEKSVLDEEYYTGGEYSVTLEKSHGGLGVTLKERDGFLCVEGLYSGDSLPGPAERAGVQIGDRLLGIESCTPKKDLVGDQNTGPSNGQIEEGDQGEVRTEDKGVPPPEAEEPEEASVVHALTSVEELVMYLKGSEEKVTLRFSRPADSVYTGLTKKAAFPAAYRLPVLLHEDDLITAPQARQIDAQMAQLISRAKDFERGTLFPEYFTPSSSVQKQLRDQLADFGMTSVKTPRVASFLPASKSKLQLDKDEAIKKRALGSSPMRTRDKVRSRSALRPAISIRIINTDIEAEKAEADQPEENMAAISPLPSSPPRASGENKRASGLGKLGHYTVYIIWVFDCRSGAEWKCRRRFSQFRQLQEHICRLYPGLAEMNFPPRVPETYAVINDRKERLETWLRHMFGFVFLVPTMDPVLAQVYYCLQEFLDVPPRLESLRMLESRPERENRQKIQVWVYQLLSLPFFDKLLANFVDHLKRNQKSGQGMLKQMKQFINHLQTTLLEGCYKEIRKIIGHDEHPLDQTWQSEEKTHTLVSKGIRRQIETEVYIPLMGILMERLQVELADEEKHVRYKIDCKKHLPQSYFGVPLHRLSPSSWDAAIFHLKAVDGFTLPCDKLDTLVACANEIPALFNREHPDSDNPLGADEFLPIFIYVLIHSGINELVLLTTVLCSLCDPDKRLAETGYYLATFEAAVQHIRELDTSV